MACTLREYEWGDMEVLVILLFGISFKLFYFVNFCLFWSIFWVFGQYHSLMVSTRSFVDFGHFLSIFVNFWRFGRFWSIFWSIFWSRFVDICQSWSMSVNLGRYFGPFMSNLVSVLWNGVLQSRLFDLFWSILSILGSIM